MSIISKRLQALGIGTKSPEQKEREASPVLSSMSQRRQPSLADIQEQQRINRARGVTYDRFDGRRGLRSGEKLRNIGGLTYVIPETEFDTTMIPQMQTQSMNPVVPGTQGGLFNIDEPSVSVTRDISTETETEETDSNTGEIPKEEPRFNYIEDSLADQNIISRGIDLGIQDLRDRIKRVEEQGGIREGLGGLGDTGEFSEGTTINTTGVDLSQDPIKNTVRTIVRTVKEKAQEAKDFAERQKQAYLENVKKRQQEKASNMVIEMENQLMQQMMERDQKRKDAFELIELENQVQAANNQMDRTNYLLRESGLFGQGMDGPSYDSLMQPVTATVMPDDIGMSPYARPEYYEGQEAISPGPVDYYNIPRFTFVPNPSAAKPSQRPVEVTPLGLLSRSALQQPVAPTVTTPAIQPYSPAEYDIPGEIPEQLGIDFTGMTDEQIDEYFDNLLLRNR